MKPGLPRAATPFIDFTQQLRAAGFAVSSEQTQTFIEAVGLLGPRSIQDIYRAANAVLAPRQERIGEFDALFRKVFLGQTLAASVDGDDEDEVEAFDERDGHDEILEADDINEVGEIATAAETLSTRRFAALDDDAALARLRRHGARLLPQRRTLRHRAARRGTHWDMRRTLRDAVRRDGEVLEIPRRARTLRQRRIVLLIDVSGSMKTQTEIALRFAHTLARTADRLETFTLGTRLTRVSRALRHPREDRALAAAASIVADIDGGTRLGDALEAFLAVPRFAGFTRGALVVVVSDGLERGEHEAMRRAVERLSKLAWHLGWLTPLAADQTFAPRTEALSAVLPYLDGLASGADAAALCHYVCHVRAGKIPDARSAA